MAVSAHKTEYFIIERSSLQKKANTAERFEMYEPLCQSQAVLREQPSSNHTLYP